MPVEIRTLYSGDEHLLQHLGEDLFDDPLHAQRTQEFLADPRHHLVVALDGDLVVGFVSAVHYVHPDKPQPELWINEVGTAETHRGRGLGKAMMAAMLDVARRLGCAEAWVLTERDNVAALKLYTACGGEEAAPETVMFNFSLKTPA